MKATKKAVARWLLEVMGRQVPQSVTDAKRNAETATPAFALRFEAAAFCQESQDAVVGAERYWNEASVSRALEAWCKEHLTPAELAILPAEAEAAPLTNVGKHLYARFLNAEDDRAALSVLALMHSVDGVSFAWVARNDFRAADLVVGRGWRLADAESRDEWNDELVVRRKAGVLMSAYRDAVATAAPPSPGLGNFKNLSAICWLVAAETLTAAIARHGRELLPVLREEMTNKPRVRLFGG